MNETELQALAQRFRVELPAAYREILLSYPFPDDSYAAEFLLPDDAAPLTELNDGALPIPGVSKPFFIGSDGGEERYFIDADSAASPIYVFELETGKHAVKAATWAEYFDQIRATLAEIEADEKAMTARHASKSWWQFWR